MYMTQLLSTRHRFSLLLMAPTVTVAHTHAHIDFSSVFPTFALFYF